MTRTRIIVAAALALASLAPPAAAQIAGPPFVFVDGTTISAAEVNSNFATIYANALNRTGGTMTGPLLFSADNAHDIGASATTRPRDLHLARNAAIAGTLAVTGASTFTGAATFAGAIASNGGLTITSATTPQLTVRYDASNRLEWLVSSAGLVTGNAVGAGQAFSFLDPVTVPAFVSTGTGTISGAWTFTSAITTLASANPVLLFTETGATANEGHWRMVADADTLSLQTSNDLDSSHANIFTVSRTGTTVDTFALLANTITLSTAAGTARWTVDASGHLVPGADATYNIGSATLGVDSLYLDNGTNSAPSLRFRNDPDSGIFWDTVGPTLSITVNGSDSWQFGATGAVFSTVLSANGASSPSFRATGVTFANIGTTPYGTTNGTILYCTDCTIASPCAGGGTGAIAKRLNATWVCD